MASANNWKPATDAENAYFAELEAAEELEELAAAEAALAAENAYFAELEAAEDEDEDEDAYRLRAYSELRGF